MSLFPIRIPRWPIRDTRRGFVGAWAVFPARLQGLAAVSGARSVRFCKKIPDAVFRGGVARAGRGFLQGVSHLRVTPLAAFGG
jgi:hypothetical protein